MDPSSETTAAPASPPIHLELELDEDMSPIAPELFYGLDDTNDSDDGMLPVVHELSTNSQHTHSEHESPPAVENHASDHEPESYQQPDPESPFGTPPAEPIPLWTEHETLTLARFLQTARGPLSVGQVAEHMARSVTDTTAMAVCVWLSAIRVSEARGARIPWWVGRPIFNSTGIGRVSVFSRDDNRIMMSLYDAQGGLEAEAPIREPSQIYDEGSF